MVRACGARARGREGGRRGGFYEWRKWSPCSIHAPCGLVPGIDTLPVDGGLDDLSDIPGWIDAGLVKRIDEIKRLARADRLDEVHPSHLMVLIGEIERLHERSAA